MARRQDEQDLEKTDEFYEPSRPFFVSYGPSRPVSVLGAADAFADAMAESSAPESSFDAAIDDAVVESTAEELAEKVGAFARRATSDEFRRFTEVMSAQLGITLRKEPPQKARDWQIDFGPVSAPAGRTTTITISPQCDFRGEKVTATDTATVPGTGTRIMSVLIGQRPQKIANDRTSTLTGFFAATALANGLRWDTCPKSLAIAVTVSFVQSCTFDMSVFGKAVL